MPDIVFGSVLPPRFWAKVNVNPESGCWNWTGAVYGKGYGAYRHDGKTRLVHRVVYRTMVGELVTGLHIDHLCKNRLCVNPRHMEQVTPWINNIRGDSESARRARLTCCERCGSDFSFRSNGDRICMKCRKEWTAKWRAAQKGKSIKETMTPEAHERLKARRRAAYQADPEKGREQTRSRRAKKKAADPNAPSPAL